MTQHDPESVGGWLTPQWDSPPDAPPYSAPGLAPRQPLGHHVRPPEPHSAHGPRAVTLTGTVRSPKHERESAGQGLNRHVLTFTLLAYDDRGTARATSVQMTGWGVDGIDPNEGEQVEVSGSMDRYGVLVATRIVNLDTRASTVVGGRSTKWGRRVIGVLVLAVAATVAVVLTRSATSSPSSAVVPSIVAGMSAETAQSLIDDAGLHWVPDLRSDAQIPPDHVIRVSPGSGTKVDKGSTVHLYISSGPP